MTPRRFARLLGTAGPALDAWNPAEREAARDLLARSPRARRRFLASVAAEPGAPAGPAALARLGHAVARTPQLAAKSRRLAPVSVGGWAALAAAAALGAWLGRPVPSPTPTTLLAALELSPFGGGAP